MSNNLSSISLPEDLKNEVRQSFVDAKAYAQVSSLHDEKIFPRTVHVNYSPELNVFFINVHQNSRKYQTALNQASFSGCYWDINHATQFVWQAKAELLDTNKNSSFQISSWLCMREEIRLAYYLDSNNLNLTEPMIDPNSYSLDTPAPNHAVIVFSPNYWDIFKISTKEHRFSTRTIYTWDTPNWSKQNVSILHTP